MQNIGANCGPNISLNDRIWCIASQNQVFRHGWLCYNIWRATLCTIELLLASLVAFNIAKKGSFCGLQRNVLPTLESKSCSGGNKNTSYSVHVILYYSRRECPHLKCTNLWQEKVQAINRHKFSQTLKPIHWNKISCKTKSGILEGWTCVLCALSYNLRCGTLAGVSWNFQ